MGFRHAGRTGDGDAFAARAEDATTDDSGRWSVWFSPIPDAGGPFELVVKGPRRRYASRTSSRVTSALRPVKSNMEWPVAWAANPDQEKQAAKYPEIRLVRTMHRVREFPVDDFVGTAWEPCTPASVEHFLAVGYHFGRLLHARLRIPIGVIQTAWGGTPAEAWTSLRGIAADASLMPIFQEWARVEEQHQTELYRQRYRWMTGPAKRRKLAMHIGTRPRNRRCEPDQAAPGRHRDCSMAWWRLWRHSQSKGSSGTRGKQHIARARSFI